MGPRFGQGNACVLIRKTYEIWCRGYTRRNHDSGSRDSRNHSINQSCLPKSPSHDIIGFEADLTLLRKEGSCNISLYVSTCTPYAVPHVSPQREGTPVLQPRIYYIHIVLPTLHTTYYILHTTYYIHLHGTFEGR
jgi:hypothetical protein